MNYKRKPNWYCNALKKILSQHRHCEECGCLETADNILLKYKCGKWLCDECFVKLYHIKLD